MKEIASGRNIPETLLFAIIEHEQKRHELHRNKHKRAAPITKWKTVPLTTRHYSCIQFVQYDFFCFHNLPTTYYLRSSILHSLPLSLIGCLLFYCEKHWKEIFGCGSEFRSPNIVYVQHSLRSAFNSISVQCTAILWMNNEAKKKIPISIESCNESTHIVAKFIVHFYCSVIIIMTTLLL